MVHWGQAHIRLMLVKTIHFTILLVIAYNVCLSTERIQKQGHTQGHTDIGTHKHTHTGMGNSGIGLNSNAILINHTVRLYQRCIW